MRILKAEYIQSVTQISQRRKEGLPEIGFIGRSNVGKSSLINCLLLRKIARTSSTPGATRAINLFRVEYEYRGKRRSLIFSDFPGFGYTALPKKIYEGWERMINEYVSQNEFVKRIIWVFDVRRDFDELDELTLGWLKSKNLPFSFVLTKVDKVNKNLALAKRKDVSLRIGDVPIFFASAKEKTGRKELLSHIFEIASKD